MGSHVLVILAVFLESFLLGSIPWGVVISHLFMHDDVREHGSGNIGTTNMIRAYGKKVGYICFVLDFLKAIIACILANVICSWAQGAGYISDGLAVSGSLGALASFGAITGHIFSPWLGFKGGKGIAAGGGCLPIAFGPVYFIVELAAFSAVTAATKTVSAGSITAAVLFPIMGLIRFWGNIPAIILILVAGILVVWSHRGNIQRLRAGTESKFGKSK